MIGMRRTLFVLRSRWRRSFAQPARKRSRRRNAGGTQPRSSRPGSRTTANGGSTRRRRRRTRPWRHAARRSATSCRAMCRSCRSACHYGEGKTWAGSVSMTTWVLFQLAAQGRIVRGRPRGRLGRSQWSWAPASEWLAAAGRHGACTCPRRARDALASRVRAGDRRRPEVVERLEPSRHARRARSRGRRRGRARRPNGGRSAGRHRADRGTRAVGRASPSTPR